MTFLLSCSEEKTNSDDSEIKNNLRSDFDSIQIRKGFNESMYFDFLGNNRVLSSMDDTTTERATSRMEVVKVSDSLDQRVGVETIYRCKAYLSKDTINIYITNSFEVGYGIKLKVVNEKFQALPYSSTLIVETDTIPVVILNQRLRLHKTKFVVGDSIFGELHVRAKEGIMNWYADGLFKAKIEKEEKL